MSKQRKNIGIGNEEEPISDQDVFDPAAAALADADDEERFKKAVKKSNRCRWMNAGEMLQSLRDSGTGLQKIEWAAELILGTEDELHFRESLPASSLPPGTVAKIRAWLDENRKTA